MSHIVVEKGRAYIQGGRVDSGSVTYGCGKGEGVYSGRVAYIAVEKEVYSEREGYILSGSHIFVGIMGGGGRFWEGHI